MSLKILNNITNPVEKRVEKIERHLFFTGIIFAVLAFFVAGTVFMVKFIVGAVILMLAYICFYVAYKIREIRREIFKHFK